MYGALRYWRLGSVYREDEREAEIRRRQAFDMERRDAAREERAHAEKTQEAAGTQFTCFTAGAQFTCFTRRMRRRRKWLQVLSLLALLVQICNH